MSSDLNTAQRPAFNSEKTKKNHFDGVGVKFSKFFFAQKIRLIKLHTPVEKNPRIYHHCRSK